ncbi:PD-(D/E)XK nuclease superfamily protein [Fusobacterium sp. oral taxon 370]|uniref:PD-(D/E)XK nuclease superfamily protein n=1 Tax=Fusobacterium sp. oral taxon 370 TaxID=712288 RepID=UPI0002F578A8|nr:PD-(D/E)XK nuclease superfamily protein [Fusobacterium sp. oral taxon 370]
MIKGGTGGANTQSGLSFEAMVDLSDFLNKQSGYQVVGQDVLYNRQHIAKIFKKYELYNFLCAQGIDWRNVISSKLLPDNSIYVFNINTIFIIECKYQNTYGSVDEKLQTCDFKKKQYQKLMSFLGIKVEYFYLLNDWFREYKYTDVLDYINSVRCHYYFNSIPLSDLGLPE